MKLPVYLSLLRESERTLAESFRQVAEGHGDEPDVHLLCLTLAEQCDGHREQLAPIVERYGAAPSDDEPERLHADGLRTTRTGPLGLLRDLQDLYLLASLAEVTWTMVKQAAEALRDEELLGVVNTCQQEVDVQLHWLQTRMKQAAPQALIAAS
ncbi:hypothetical protein J2X63_003447 [Agromyces sp. 3263]|uniref:hypothetical protein n=1 Tax=Agromyces sp. 3263 TaxID=2817750 RepID=UPI00285E7178|nr:hypothetical protein [Agromyces sp. 3263]MDR6907739.1 hypothetical protein [Agromyces sp. 3263]